MAHFKNRAGFATVGDRRKSEKTESKNAVTKLEYLGLVLEDELLNHLAIPESAMAICEADFPRSAVAEHDHGVLSALDFVTNYVATYGEAPSIAIIAAEVGYQDFYEPQTPVE